MTYNQIKNLLIPPAKRTAQTVQKWVAKLPDLPYWPYLAGKITVGILTMNLTAILLSGFLCPSIPVTYAMLVAGIMVFLAAYTVYQNREAIAKAMVLVLAKL